MLMRIRSSVVIAPNSALSSNTFFLFLRRYSVLFRRRRLRRDGNVYIQLFLLRLMRLFVAFPVVDERLRQAQHQLAAGLPTAEIRLSHHIHSTLAFFGDQPDQVVENIRQRLRSVRAAPFSAYYGRHCAFPHDRFFRVAGILLEPISSFLTLRHKIFLSLRGLFVEPQEKYTPHITLVRLGCLRSPQQFLARLSRLSLDGNITVDRVQLLTSELRPDGAHYRVLAEFPLSSDVS